MGERSAHFHYCEEDGNVTFTVGDDSLKWLVRPVDVHITEQDVAVGLADGEGIDIDALEQCVMSGFSAGKRIELAGLSFDEAEANRVFSFIKQ